MRKSVKALTICLVSLAGPVLFSGCATTFPIPQKDLTANIQGTPYNATVQLVMPKSYCDYVWVHNVGMGNIYKVPLGQTLCLNHEKMLQKAFTKVIRTQDGHLDGIGGVDLIAVPKLISYDYVPGVTAFHESRQTIKIEWTVTDTQGNILWVDTLQAVGAGASGTAFSYKNNTRDYAYEMLANLHKDAYEALMQSPEIKNYISRLAK